MTFEPDRTMPHILLLALLILVSCDTPTPTTTPAPTEVDPTSQELHFRGVALLESGDFKGALESLEGAYSGADTEARKTILFDIVVAAAKAKDCPLAARAIAALEDPELAGRALQAAVGEGCRTTQSSPRVGGPPPPPSPSVGVSEGVLTAEVNTRAGNPFDRSGDDSEDFEYSCYLGNGKGAAATRYIRVGKSDSVSVHSEAGRSGPGTAIPVAPGTVVSVRSEVVITVSTRGYRVTQSGKCSCPATICYGAINDSAAEFVEAGLDPAPPIEVQLTEGQIVSPRVVDSIGPVLGPFTACSFPGEPLDAEFECEDDSWLTERGMKCFREHVEAVALAPPKGVAPGWWIQLEQGWVHADGEFELQVQCDGECETKVDQCIDELGCKSKACERKCAALNQDCKPTWQSAELSG